MSNSPATCARTFQADVLRFSRCRSASSSHGISDCSRISMEPNRPCLLSPGVGGKGSQFRTFHACGTSSSFRLSSRQRLRSNSARETSSKLPGWKAVAGVLCQKAERNYVPLTALQQPCRQDYPDRVFLEQDNFHCDDL